MLTKDSDRVSRTDRTLAVPFNLAVSIVVLICVMLTAAALLLTTTNNLEKSPREILNEWTANNGWKSSKGVRIREALSKVPARYAASLGAAPEMPTLVIDIKFKHQEQLRGKREIALARGMLIQEEDDMVPAEIRTDGRHVDVKLRLKGDQPDHFDSDKWSMRIEVKGGDHILGMRRFSIQHPKVRGYQAEPLFMETLRHVGVLGVRYQFVHVVINGEDKGIMALEEHFAKELLEHQARREGVFARFDETNFWDFQRDGGQWRSSPYDNFRISRVSTFRATKVAETPNLSDQYQVAVGLLRGFAAGKLAATDVFDVDAISSYLAVLELWGSWHGIQWNDMRFYFDPITMKLEPVGYDANLQLQSDLRAVTLRREPIYAALLQDPNIRREYVNKLRSLCRDITEGELGDRLDSIQSDLLADLRHEFLLLEPLDLGNVLERAEFLLGLDDSELLADPDTYPRRIRFGALLQANLIHSLEGPYIEVANLIPEPVTITALEWRVSENTDVSAVANPMDVVADSTEFPMVLPPSIQGAIPKFERINVSMPEGIAGGNLTLTAIYPSWPQGTEIIPISYFPEIGKNPVPDATVADLISRHPYIRIGDRENELEIIAGHWTVANDIIIPAGMILSAGPGAELEFSDGVALISYSALRFSGSKDRPVRLTGVGSGNWQGLAVMQATVESQLSHVEVSGTRGIDRGAWQLTGGVSFYRSDVVMKDVFIGHHDGEDALNIVRASFNIQRLTISDTLSDGFDADFTTGTIRDSDFTDIGRSSGGDAIDISGSDVTVEQVRFRNVADKAFSVGEGSRANAVSLTMTSVGTAIASKDGSQLNVDGVTIDSVIFAGLMAYTKKPEYGPASIYARNVDFETEGPIARAQNGSVIELDGEEVETEDLDVDLLYETVMRKGN